MDQVKLAIAFPRTGPDPQPFACHVPRIRDVQISLGDAMHDLAIWWGLNTKSLSKYFAGFVCASRYPQLGSKR